MGGLLWAISAFIFIMLIVYFLPIGFTKKGKFMVVIAGFLLAMAGVEAASVFSLWLTLFMLVVLIFFVSYLLDSRAGKLLYLEDVIDKDQYIDEDLPEPRMNDRTYKNENIETEISPDSLPLLKENPDSHRRDEQKNIESEIPVIETDNDDISFLLNRSLAIEEEKEKKTEEPKQVNDYLAEIEELLDAVPKEEPESKKQLDSKVKPIEVEIEEIPVLSFHEKEGEN